MRKEDVSFIRKGEGKDLVFLHGYLSSKEAFLPFLDYFSGRYRVTAFDFCGFGQSAPLTSPFSVSDYAAWTGEAFRLLGIEKPYCIAHSFGCRVAVKMQAIAPLGKEIFDKMIFTGPAGLLPRRTWKYRLKVKAYRAVKKW